jgi:hypothetical protein
LLERLPAAVVFCAQVVEPLLERGMLLLERLPLELALLERGLEHLELEPQCFHTGTRLLLVLFGLVSLPLELLQHGSCMVVLLLELPDSGIELLL